MSATPQPNPTANQVFGRFTCTVMKAASDGVRYIRITKTIDVPRNNPRGAKIRSYAVPVDIASLAAGKDAWMRNILVRCSDPACRKIEKVGDLQNGYCPKCIEDAERENAIADGHEGAV